MFKKIISGLISLFMLFSAITLTSANAEEIYNIYGSSTKIYTTNNDIFYISGAKPGDSWETDVHVVNSSKTPFTITLQEIKNSDSILPPYMYLKVVHRGLILYNAEYLTDQKPIFEPIEIPAFSDEDIIITCGIYEKTDNIIQNEKLETRWIFEARSIASKDNNNTGSGGKTQHIALGNNVIPAQDDVICYDEYGNILLSGQQERYMGLYIKAPDIEGYEPDDKYIFIFNSVNGKYYFTYHKIKKETNTDTNLNNTTANVSENNIYDNNPNDFDQKKDNNNESSRNNIQGTHDSQLNGNIKSKDLIGNIKQLFENTNQISDDSSNITDNINFNNSDHYTADDKTKDDNNNIAEKLRRLVSNTKLVTWWIIVFVILSIVYIIFIVKKYRKNRRKKK